MYMYNHAKSGFWVADCIVYDEFMIYVYFEK